MRKVLIALAALTAGALSLNASAGQQIQQTAANDEMKATGTVTDVDQDKHEITIGDQTYMMPPMGGGAAMMPQVGADVTITYEVRDGMKTVTRIGQAQ